MKTIKDFGSIWVILYQSNYSLNQIKIEHFLYYSSSNFTLSQIDLKFFI